MQPLSTHWADIAAIRIIKQQGDKDSYTLASGITPSGNVHFGNFREVITVDLVARSLKKLGKKVRFIYSWDNFDTFRKVPMDLPQRETFDQYLRESIARIPDPWGEEESYAASRCKAFEKELDEVGIKPDFIYQEEQYSKGTYAEKIIHALENKETLAEILNEHRTSKLDDDWLPTSVYCKKCKKDEMKTQSYKGNGLYFYECQNCSFSEEFDIRKSSDLKLSWRVDWPMRWAHEKVDFEPGGKDHSSEGGSYDTGKTIVEKLWQQKPPVYLQYDFVKIKGGAGKMSSSKGELYTLTDLFKVYEPQILRWIFVSQRPNHDFGIALDEDVFKVYEEFDRCEKKFFELQKEKELNKKDQANKRVYELSLAKDQEDFSSLPPVKRASFRKLCNYLQICAGDIQRTFEKFYEKDGLNFKSFEKRAKKACYWIAHYANEDFRYTLRSGDLTFKLSDEQKEAVNLCRNFVTSLNLETLEPKEINKLLWDNVINKSSCDSKIVFQGIYQCLINRDQGPRLPGFIKELGKEKVLELLTIK